MLRVNSVNWKLDWREGVSGLQPIILKYLKGCNSGPKMMGYEKAIGISMQGLEFFFLGSWSTADPLGQLVSSNLGVGRHSKMGQKPNPTRKIPDLNPFF